MPQKRRSVLFAALLLSGIACPVLLRAQSVEGRVNGTVTDPAGKLVPGAQVVLKSLDTNAERTTTASDTGTFVIPSLPPGRYSATVSSAGFQQYVIPEFRLQVNESRSFDIRLTVGQVNQTVEVQAAAAALNTTDATIGTVIQHENIVEIPLNGRNFTQLILLAPGAAAVQTGQQNSFTTTGGISPAINGMRAQMNNFTLDGIENNMRFTNTYAVSPPPDAIEEFAVANHQTSPDAAFAAGANINIVTRPGTTGLHGSVWEFLRNDKFSARNYFDNYFGNPTLPFRQNQFGFFVGGPVIIPKLMDGRRSRTFFAAYYEGLKYRKSLTTQATVPDQAQRAGDFSALLGPPIGTDCRGRAVRQGQIYDPATTVLDPACPGGFIRDPFPNNQIPANRITPIAQTYLKYLYPLPNRTGAPNLILAQSQKQDAFQYGIRSDHYFSDSQRIYGRVSRYENRVFTPAGLPGDGVNRLNSGTNVIAHYNKVFSPTFLFDFTFGYNRSGIPFHNVPLGDAFNSEVGSQYFLTLPQGAIPVGQALSGSRYSQGTWVSYELANPDYTFQYHGDFKKVRGRHEMGFGLRYARYRHIAETQGAASLTYQRETTNLPAFGTTTGEPIASFYLGLPVRSNYALLPTFNDYGNIYTGYWGDTWKVSSKLTLNYGMQYVYASPPRVEGDQISLFDLNLARTQPNATDFTFAFYWCATNPITNAPGNCPRPTLVKPDYNNFAPRFGLAYTPWKNTVVRAGFGIFYDFNTNIEQNSVRISQGIWPYSTQQQVSGQNLTTIGPYNPPLSQANPFPKPPVGPPTPTFTINLDNRNPHALEWNFGVEQLLPKDWKLSTNYVGSGGRHLVLVTEENVAVIGPGPIADRRPVHNIGSIGNRENTGNSNYHSLQAKIEKNLSASLTFLNSFTWSRSLDIHSDANAGSIQYTYNKRLSYGPSDFNIPLINVTSFVYNLPFGRGRSMGANMPRALDVIAGGWETSGIVTLRSGLPFSIFSGIDNANIGSTTNLELADILMAPTHSGFEQNRAHWFDKSAFGTPALNTIGTSSRNMLRGPSYRNVDFSAMKNFVFTEKLRLQFRAEFFNIFNHTNFGTPANRLTDPNFGAILSALPSRDVQFGLKLLW